MRIIHCCFAVRLQKYFVDKETLADSTPGMWFSRYEFYILYYSSCNPLKWVKTLCGPLRCCSYYNLEIISQKKTVETFGFSSISYINLCYYNCILLGGRSVQTTRKSKIHSAPCGLSSGHAVKPENSLQFSGTISTHVAQSVTFFIEISDRILRKRKNAMQKLSKF